MPLQRTARVAAILITAMRQPAEVRNVHQLAEIFDLRVRSLQLDCEASGISAKQCLDFVRCFHIVARARKPWDPRRELARRCKDRRTIARLLHDGGLDTASPPTIHEFLARQRLVRDRNIVACLAAELTHTAHVA